MINTIQSIRIGDIYIEHRKWWQGRLIDHIVTVYRGKSIIFDEEDMGYTEANKLYLAKLKEYPLTRFNTYELYIKNANREWTEKYIILKGEDVDSQVYFSNMLQNFNDTLRPNELPRTLIKIVVLEEAKQ